MKKVILLLLSFCALSVFAASPPTTHWTYHEPDGWFPSYAAACDAWFAKRAAMETDPKVSLVFRSASDNSCSAERIHVNYGSYGFVGASLIKQVRCPDGYTLENGLCEPPEEPSRCAADAGTSSVMNFTVGWARSGTPDADDHVGKVVFPNQGRGAACVGGCSWDFTDNGVTAYRSAEPFPASGLHRLSVDFTMRGAGTACAESPEDAAASPNAPEPPCPGFVGEVNGVTKCVGTASQPVPPPDGPTAGRQAGGSEDNGNPAAGKKPDSGDGSGSGGPGRTPTAGTGGNAGGPAGAAGGTRPDGTTTKPVEGKEQAACGAPGQPKCSINETGTPDGKGAYDAAKAGLDKAEGDYKAGLDAIKNTADKDTSWGVVPSWISHAECRPWDLGAFEIMGQSFAIVISICDVMPYVVATTSFLWVVATFFLTIAMVFRVTAAPQG